ncbi:thioredoxin domain-containing protein [Hymenobacter humi]|uniref:Thioredoxin domain-containing protein n=1 Tax=Hymenobacter humi TaxID=1411620 RepID=A0ABW2U6Y5_9BACT
MIENLINSAVIDTNDEGLRRYTHDRLKVFAKFTAEDCATCGLLAPGFRKVADDQAYQGILFVRLNSDENPVAKLMMAQREAPFFVSYCQGRLLECETCDTPAAMVAQLDRLRAFKSHTA